MNDKFCLWIFLMVYISATTVARAEVKLPRVFGDDMVLQQRSQAALWSWARPGEHVTVSFAGKTATAVAGQDGKWKLAIKTPAAGGPYELKVVGDNTITLKNVLVGEVWLAAAKCPQVRMLTVRNPRSATPLDDVQGQWLASTPEHAGDFSAVAYFFARRVQKELGVPVGIVSVAVGGTSIQSWMGREWVAKVPWSKNRLDEWDALMARTPAETLTKFVPTAPPARENPMAGRWPLLMYNTQLLPVTPYAIRGVLWYQGEHHVGRHDDYRALLPLLVQEWRSLWGDQNLPFYSVQLHPYGTDDLPSKLKFPEFREAQTALLSQPHTGLAVAIDTGDPKDGHPREKRPIGYRLAALALNKTYGRRETVCSGPWYQSMKTEGSKIRIRFKEVAGGLVVQGDKLEGFAVAGADRQWVRAEAKLDKGDVVVWNDQVPQPVAVRYAWTDFPPVTLYNQAGFPAAPFRTDDWPIEPPPEP